MQLFEGVFAECYGPYTDENENKGSFGPGGSSPWEWSSPQSLGGMTYSGEVTTYGGGGFYADLPRDRRKVLLDQGFAGCTFQRRHRTPSCNATPVQAETLLQQLREGKWLDEASRMLFVDINLYNPNHNVFVLVNLLIEMPPTAGLLPRSALRPSPWASTRLRPCDIV